MRKEKEKEREKFLLLTRPWNHIYGGVSLELVPMSFAPWYKVVRAQPYGHPSFCALWDKVEFIKWLQKIPLAPLNTYSSKGDLCGEYVEYIWMCVGIHFTVSFAHPLPTSWRVRQFQSVKQCDIAHLTCDLHSSPDHPITRPWPAGFKDPRRVENAASQAAAHIAG